MSSKGLFSYLVWFRTRMVQSGGCKRLSPFFHVQWGAPPPIFPGLRSASALFAAVGAGPVASVARSGHSPGAETADRGRAAGAGWGPGAAHLTVWGGAWRSRWERKNLGKRLIADMMLKCELLCVCDLFIPFIVNL